MNTTKKEVKVGLIGVGLNTYWNQFEGLLSRLTDYQRMIKERMSGLQATVIDGGMVDSPEKAAQTAEVLKSEDIEILFIFISTYALSSTILPIAQRIKIPVILLNIQPVAAINYDYINGLGDYYRTSVKKLFEKYGKNWQVNGVGSLSCIFFTDRPVCNYEDAKTADTAEFGRTLTI